MRAMLFAAGLMLAGLTAGDAYAQAKQDFVLVNRTGYTLSHIYVGPTKSDDWGDDVMGPNVVPDGTSVQIRFSPKVNTCKWDVKVTYEVDDSSVYWRDIDLCQIDKMTIFYDKASDRTRATYD